MSIKITSITIVDRELTDNGKRLLGFFAIDIDGLCIRGCQLVKTEKRGIAFYPPRIDGPAGELRAVEITDDSLRHKIMTAALDAYRLLGGAYGDWEPRA
jgi:hypothetical protein